MELREISVLDALIDTAIKGLLEQKASDFPDDSPAFGKLADDLVGIVPDKSDSRQVRGWPRLQSGLEALVQCKKNGAAKYLGANPTAVSDLMTIGEIPDAEDRLIGIEKSQKILLKQFNVRWNEEVKPLLAERVEKYGREKLTAEGLTKAMRDWFDVNRDVLVNLKDRYEFPAFRGFLSDINEINSNPDAKQALENLLEPNSYTLSDYNSLLDELASKFEVAEKCVTPNNIETLKENGLRDALFNDLAGAMQRKNTPEEEAIHQLRDRFWDLVEMPYYVTSNILKVPYRGH